MGIDDNDETSFFNRKSNYDMNSKIMLTAIISLSFVVILVTILHIYARFLLRRQSRRQAELRRLGFITASANIQSASEPPKTGLDPAVMAALPHFIYRKTSSSNDDDDDDDDDETSLTECSVCLSILEDGEIARTLPNCKHTFHAECIDKWFVTNSTCPICRMDAEPRLVPEPREGVVVVVVAAGGGAPPSAPPLEGTSDKNSSGSRLSSFRRILSRERSSSSRRMQTSSVPDLERQ
ncbi:hypothetical protein ABFS82_08G207600 [Erythranthe guttata]|uniref:RING-type domain-containing protein n=1 Tax=Erythranthe guttata TaxID=4155 RepID=A0A022QTZ5_ERYGU|nr:PREDICTED: RING-H2 finger protein ATL40-like [Erythranthe guttata]EYU30788.1 hypothetical protein MIMGU_mgv1a024357mg [Erythranthe guttata]|eukprot:XP_012845043.1 PREDICTED: RING-H2 finger protein ATL40-like [Erythranthe guttata]